MFKKILCEDNIYKNNNDILLVYLNYGLYEINKMFLACGKPNYIMAYLIMIRNLF